MTPSPQWVALVGGAGLPEVRRAVARRGLRAIALGDASSLEKIPDDPVIVAREAVDFARPSSLVGRLQELHRAGRLAAIVPFTEFGLLPAAIAAERLGLPTTPATAVRRTRDKVVMRRALAEAGFHRPRFLLCRDAAQVETFRRTVGGTVVVKPSASTGSLAVCRVDSAAGVAAAFAAARGARGGGSVLCEEYLEGPEVSVEAVVSGGRFTPVAVTAKRLGEGFVEVGHVQPAMLPGKGEAELMALVRDALAALGVDGAVTHTEVRLTPAGPALVETHTRMGGDRIHRLTELTTGVDLADVTVALALGEAPEVRPCATGRAAAIRYLMGGPDPARLAAIEEPPEDIRAAVEDYRLEAGAGQSVGPCRSSGDRLGWALAVGSDAGAAEAVARRWVDSVRLTWDAAPPATGVAAAALLAGEGPPCRAAS